MGQPLMKVIDLLYLAKQNVVDIDLQEDQVQLKLSRNKPADKGLIEQLKSNKQQIIDFLKDCRKSSVRAVEKISRTKAEFERTPSILARIIDYCVRQQVAGVVYTHPRIMVSRGCFVRGT
jgi:hypothetical protein